MGLDNAIAVWITFRSAFDEWFKNFMFKAFSLRQDWEHKRMFRRKDLELHIFTKCDLAIYSTSGGMLVICIPFLFQAYIHRDKMKYGWKDCSLQNDRSGFYIHTGTFWICRRAKKNWSKDFPWVYSFYQKSVLTTEGWKVTNNQLTKENYVPKPEEIVTETYPAQYEIKDRDDTVTELQEFNATITYEEMTWRMHMFFKIPLFQRTRRYIDIKYDAEVGPGRGSYKGGVLGTGAVVLPGETGEQTLRRHLKERRYRR